MQDIIVRQLCLDDFDNGFPEVLTSLAPVDLDRETAIRLFKETSLFNGRQWTLVALHEKTVVGTATLIIEQKYIHGGGLVAHIEDVAVDPYFQGQGVGAALVGWCMEEARTAGCYKVILDCADEVRGFYERLGFHLHQHHMRYDIDAIPERPAEGT